MSAHRFALLIAVGSLACSGAPQTTPNTTETPPVETTPPPSAAGQTMFVHESLVDCEGVAPMKCMQVRSNESEDWTWFYDSIEGFTHEPGYRYELRVEVTEVENPPADGSSKKYRLIETVSKQKVEEAGE
jgi:hypothetical protein